MLGARVLVHEAAEEEEVAQRLRGTAVERDLARQRLAPGQLRARVRVRARGRDRVRVRVMVRFRVRGLLRLLLRLHLL